MTGSQILSIVGIYRLENTGCVLDNYYYILGLEPSCSLEEIKRSFRKKAKELHPDLSKGNGAGRQTEQINLLITAYRVLSDPEKRQEYDRWIRTSVLTDSFDYRTFLRERTWDRSSQSKLIFFDLLHEHEDEALELYERLLQYSDYGLELFLDREDFMDCAFLLSEEYTNRGKYQCAFDLLMKIVEWERKKPYFKHFFEEVIHRLRDLSGQKLPLVSTKQEMLLCYFRLVDCNFPPKETAHYFKKISEIYLSMNRRELAAEFLEKGIKLDRTLAGVKRMKQQIGI